MKQQKGFTLIEMLVVMVIISILALIGMATLDGVQNAANDSESKTIIDTIDGSLRLAFVEEKISGYTFADFTALDTFMSSNYYYAIATSSPNTHHFFHSDDGQDFAVAVCLSDGELFKAGTSTDSGTLVCAGRTLSASMSGYQSFSF